MSDDVPDFHGDAEGYRQWRAENPQPFNPQWCGEHWAPCPVEGRPGVLATVLLMTEMFALVPEGVRTPPQLNSWWANQTVPACCQLGDERVAWLWEMASTDEKCLAPGRGRNCFLPSGHDGLHDSERSLLEPMIMSIFSDIFRAAWGREPLPPLERR